MRKPESASTSASSTRNEGTNRSAAELRWRSTARRSPCSAERPRDETRSQLQNARRLCPRIDRTSRRRAGPLTHDQMVSEISQNCSSSREARVALAEVGAWIVVLFQLLAAHLLGVCRFGQEIGAPL